MVIEVLFLFLVLISEFSKLSLTTTIIVLTPASCNYITSFNYGGKKARDGGLTCRCHLSNIMTGSIFNESMGWGITCPFLFFKGDNHCLPQHKRDGFSSLIIITPMALGKP